MKEQLYLIAFCWLFTYGLAQFEVVGEELWQAPLDTTVEVTRPPYSSLRMGDALNLVAVNNPTLRSLALQLEASSGQLKQAGLWSNPELGAEIEEVGWDAPGLNESEITVSLAQEFEFFGQRKARKNLALAEIDATVLHNRLSAYDLYLETKRRFYALVHAQKHAELSRTSAKLAGDIVNNITLRIEKGAGLQSDLLLAELEKQRAQLQVDQAQQEVKAAEAKLVALWHGEASGISAQADSEPDFAGILRRVTLLVNSIDSTRIILQLKRESAILCAEQSLAAAEARPTVTFSGGYKRLEANNSNSFLFGVSLPLPFFNRNQGARESLEARRRSLDYEVVRQRLDVEAAIWANSIRLRQLIHHHDALDSLLLPTAEETYVTLQQTYKAGRVPYTQLLEAERSLNELRFEHNDILLAIHEQIIAYEALAGVTVLIDKER